MDYSELDIFPVELQHLELPVWHCQNRLFPRCRGRAPDHRFSNPLGEEVTSPSTESTHLASREIASRYEVVLQEMAHRSQRRPDPNTSL